MIARRSLLGALAAGDLRYFKIYTRYSVAVLADQEKTA